MNIARLFLLVGSLAAMSGVLLGAFGAHALRDRLEPSLLAAYQTGVQYQFYHALGLLLVGLLLRQTAGVWLTTAGWLMIVGILVFSGSLYLLALSGLRWLGAITPLGGVALVLAWLTLAVGVWRTAG